MNRKGFFISPVVILFFFIIGGIIAVYISSADSVVSNGISYDALIRKNNIQVWNSENSFASLLRTKIYTLSRTSNSTEYLKERLYSELNISYINFANNTYPFLNVTYTSPSFSSDDGISVSMQKNNTMAVNYPLLEAVKLIDDYSEIGFCWYVRYDYIENYTLNGWKVADVTTPYLFLKNDKYNITEVYPFGVRRLQPLC